MRLRHIYKKRSKTARKGDFGRLLVVGGSFRYTGSPILSALAAYRAGCDWVTIAAPTRAADAAAHYLPDFLTYPLDGAHLTPAHVPVIEQLLRRHDAVLIGGGVGTATETHAAVKTLMANLPVPFVLDADGLRVIGPRTLPFQSPSGIFTPHLGELKRMVETDVPSENELQKRKEIVQSTARQLKGTILLKGYRDIISNGTKTVLDHNDSPFLTKAGIGDVLAGVCGALLARKLDPFDAAVSSAALVGRAGKLAANTFGESLLASDLIDALVDVTP